jgi:hypothetical protein
MSLFSRRNAISSFWLLKRAATCDEFCITWCRVRIEATGFFAESAPMNVNADETSQLSLIPS